MDRWLLNLVINSSLFLTQIFTDYKDLRSFDIAKANSNYTLSFINY
jgi:hypothetical protein